MSAEPARSWRYERPVPPATLDGEEFFAGAWWPPDRPWAAHASGGDDQKILRGPNWVVVSSRLPGTERSLAHQRQGDVVVFRGYVVEPPIHGWASAEGVLAAWLDRPPGQPNGVFACVRIRDGGRTLDITSDPFGVGSLYYRRLGDLVLFASSPRHLRTPDDRIDLLAWRRQMSGGVPVGEDCVLQDVKRVPPGTRLAFAASGEPTESRYFDFSVLPQPDRAPDPETVREVHECLLEAVERRLRAVPEAGSILPFSSGHDSRRLLGALRHHGVDFETLTVRTWQKGCLDLDGPFTSMMARDLGFPHRILEQPDPATFAALDEDRRLLLQAESTMHTWILPIRQGLPTSTALIWDGLAGDLTGETGYMDPEVFMPDEDRVMEALLEHVTGSAFEDMFAGGEVPTHEAARDGTRRWLQTLPAEHRAELAFLLTRSRRAIGAWSQRLLPAGHVVAYPYLDIDYVALALSVDPLARAKTSLQRLCLDAHEPRLASYPGSRDVPPTARRGPARRLRANLVACVRSLERRLAGGSGREQVLRRLAPHRRRQHHVARYLDRFALSTGWWRTDFLELAELELTGPAAWLDARIETEG